MTLTLTIRNFDRLENGMPTEFVLHRRGALIGRSSTCDWSLPDARSYISSRHCEIAYAEGGYLLIDTSTNGTYLNGASERMPAPHRIGHDDVFAVGQYEIVATLSGEAAVAAERAVEEAQQAQRSDWAGWDRAGGDTPPAPAPTSTGWSTPPLRPESSGTQNRGGWDTVPDSGPTPPPAIAVPNVGAGWSPSARAPDLPAASVWDQPAQRDQGASDWSSAAPDRSPPPSPDDVWGKLAEGNVVDWARGGFGQPIAETRDPLGLGRDPREALRATSDQAAPQAAAAPSQVEAAAGWSNAAHAGGSPPTPPPPPSSPVSSSADQLIAQFAAGAGIAPDKLQDLSPATLHLAGQLFQRLVAGLVVMLEARARAKSQMGAESTSFQIDGNSPIKFARTPDEAVAALLNPPVRGFMEAGRAIDDAFYDLQSHQMATLRAMQGALRATLERFSPHAIAKRAEDQRILAKIIPGARAAALWQAYEREFSGVAQGSDEAFMEVFAKEFRKAYDEQASRQRRS